MGSTPSVGIAAPDEGLGVGYVAPDEGLGVEHAVIATDTIVETKILFVFWFIAKSPSRLPCNVMHGVLQYSLAAALYGLFFLQTPHHDFGDSIRRLLPFVEGFVDGVGNGNFDAASLRFEMDRLRS